MSNRSRNDDRGVYAPSTADENAGWGPVIAPAEEGRRGSLLLAVTFVVMIALAGIIWNAYHQGVRQGGREAPPRIQADASPYKERPEDPGGLVTPHQDIEVYSRVAPEAEAADVPAPVESRSVDAAAIAERLAPLRERVPDPVLERASVAEATDDDPPTESVTVGGAPEPRLKPQPPAPPAPLVPGDFVVQVASFSDAVAADRGWRNLVARYPDLFSGRAADIEVADLGDRGTHHRLRVAGFDERGKASAFCDLLRTRGEECLVVRK